MNEFQTNIADYICSGHALLNIDTFEKDRAISEIAEVADLIDLDVYIWSITNGWTDKTGAKVGKAKPTAPVYEHLQEIINFHDNVICILRDFGPYMKHDTYPNYDIVIGWLDTLRQIIPSVGQTIVFVGPGFQVPQPLLHDITRMDFSLPGNEQINERIEFACSAVTTFNPLS